MFELLKFANENNVNVNIKVIDGSYRPLVGEVINIITFSSANNPNISIQTTILKTDSELNIKDKIMSAVSSINDYDKSFSDMMEAREKFFHEI